MPNSRVITLTTDFGHKGPFSAVMKGVILTRLPDAKIIDLAHDIPAHWPAEAGFWLQRAHGYFPPGTVHIAVVDPGVGTDRDIIIVETDDYLFLAPDNGLLAPLIESSDNVRVYRVDSARLATLGIQNPSATFHGRDIFAPLAAELASGRVTAGDVGTQTAQWIPAWLDAPEVRDGHVAGVIVTVDAFGNLISNIDASLLDAFDNPVAHLAGHAFEMQTTYGRVEPGQYLALINSFGVLEIARAEGSAAEGLGSERGAPITVTEGMQV